MERRVHSLYYYHHFNKYKTNYLVSIQKLQLPSFLDSAVKASRELYLLNGIKIIVITNIVIILLAWSSGGILDLIGLAKYCIKIAR